MIEILSNIIVWFVFRVLEPLIEILITCWHAVKKLPANIRFAVYTLCARIGINMRGAVDNSLLKDKKHGLKWTTMQQTAERTNIPQGRWSKSDLKFATKMANTLPENKSGYFDFPPNSTSIVCMPDGTTPRATKFWIRNSGKTWFGYPLIGNPSDRGAKRSTLEEGIAFKIDNKYPRCSYHYEGRDTKLSEAIFSLYIPRPIDVILFWGEEQIALSFVYDISVMIDDILVMINTLRNSTTGEWSVDWTSNSLPSNWHLKWDDESLQITAQWREEYSASDYLINNSTIKIEKKEFLYQWKKIVSTICEGIGHTNYVSHNCLSDIGLLYSASSWLDKNTRAIPHKIFGKE